MMMFKPVQLLNYLFDVEVKKIIPYGSNSFSYNTKLKLYLRARNMLLHNVSHIFTYKGTLSFPRVGFIM